MSKKDVIATIVSAPFAFCAGWYMGEITSVLKERSHSKIEKAILEIGGYGMCLAAGYGIGSAIMELAKVLVKD